MLYEINHKLPKIPERFYINAEEMKALRMTSPQERMDLIKYGSFEPPKELVDILTPYFETDIIVRYQLIQQDLPAHEDICEQDFKYNYIYDTGGDLVTTFWWEDNKPVSALICMPNIWYKINIRKKHSVSNTTRPRLSITVKEVPKNNT